MARGHAGLPKAASWGFSKSDLLDYLIAVDNDPQARQRTLAMEAEFRRRIDSHVGSLPAQEARFSKFFTSPYVLLIHARKNGYCRVSEIEHDILPAKLFSSMETSAGRMIESVALEKYGWRCVLSEMHTANSALDGLVLDGDILRVATLKSGPRCLNDEMSENFADAIINNAAAWAKSAGVNKIEFTYGVLYGTQKLSNKKDWHILRNLEDKLGTDAFSASPMGSWNCSFNLNGIDIDAAIRIGRDWWGHLGGRFCLTEIAIALIRACILPGDIDPPDHRYTISDLSQIVSLRSVPESFNPAILQRSQISWYFFFMRHFCDVLTE